MLVVHVCVHRGMWRPQVNAEYLSRSAPSYLLRQDISQIPESVLRLDWRAGELQEDPVSASPAVGSQRVLSS